MLLVALCQVCHAQSMTQQWSKVALETGVDLMDVDFPSRWVLPPLIRYR
jgi:hypothetical protein